METEINILKNAWQSNAIQQTDITAVASASLLYPYCSAIQLLQNIITYKSNTANTKTTLPKAKLYSGNLFLHHHTIQTLEIVAHKNELEDIITLPFADNYFAYAKIETSTEEVENYIYDQKQKKIDALEKEEKEDVDSSLMITMSFAEWLVYFKEKKNKEKKELESKQAVRAMWQKEKLTEAIGEENDVIPENVFKMAIDSMNLSESTASESLAEIMLKQGKTDKAIEMYRQLSLLNPQKSSYFAIKIKNILNNH
jgi:hypothetical protein